jgi:Family of unknown function (DUF5681)
MKTTAKQREDIGVRPGGITGKGFLPGQSGNPQGRPRTAKFSEACRRLSEEIGQNGRTGAEQLAEYCFRRALKGSARHAELFLNYTEGKPKQGVELSGPNNDAMKFENMSEPELNTRLKELLEKFQVEQVENKG